jgi:tetratricopeptide (TPR) repeat protein
VRFFYLPLFLLFCSTLHGHTTLVLPFSNGTGDENLDWIGESLGTAVRESLASYGLLVIGREDRLEAFRRHAIRPGAVLTKASIIKIGEALDASQVIFGSFKLAPAAKEGSRGTLEITAQMLDLRGMTTGPELAESGPLEDLAALQNRLGWQALQALAPRSAPSEREFFAARPPVRVDAIENYIRGLLATSMDQKHRFFTAAARLEESFSQPRFQLGTIYWAKQEYRIAADWFEGVTPAHPRYREAQFLLGLCRFYQGDYAAAERHFRLVAASVPLNEVWNNLGAAQLRLGSPDAATSFRKALEGDAADPDYHFNLGYALWKAGQYEEAAASFRAALDRDEGDAEAIEFLGRSLKQEGPRRGDPSVEGRERLKHDYQEQAYRQLQAELGGKAEQPLQ